MTELARPLETGWLPDTPIGDSLLRRFVANQADLQEHLAGAVGGRSDRTPDVALSDSGVAAAYMNQAVLLRPISDAYDAVLDHVASFYAGSVGLLLSPWPTPDLAGRGWQLVGHPMFVVRGPAGEPADAPPSDVNVRRAESADDLAFIACRYPANTSRWSKASVRRIAAKTANPAIMVTEFSPAVMSVRCPPSTVRPRPVAYSRNVSRVWPAMPSISSYQAGTNPISSSQASRLRAWSRSAKRHATGNCRKRRPAWSGGRGGAGRGASSVAGMVFPPGHVAGGELAVGQVGEQVEAVLLEDQVGADHDGLIASTQVTDHLPERR